MNKFIILCLVLSVLQSNCIDAFEKVKLDDIKYLDLYKGQSTIGSIDKITEQQVCVDILDDHLCSFYRPNHIRCENVGKSVMDNQIIWQCDAKLPNRIIFGRLEVSCETFPNTKAWHNFVIKGSCSLRYTLLRLTKK